MSQRRRSAVYRQCLFLSGAHPHFKSHLLLNLAVVQFAPLVDIGRSIEYACGKDSGGSE